MSKNKAVTAIDDNGIEAIVEVGAQEEDVSSCVVNQEAEDVALLSVRIDELQRMAPGGFRPPRHGD